MNLRFGLITAIAFGLGACANSQDLQGKLLGTLLDEPTTQVDSDATFKRFQPLLEAGRGPALSVKIPKFSLAGGFLLEARKGTIESWLGNDGVSLTFDRGVLHGTRGIGAGMLASDVGASASAVLAGRSTQVTRIHTFLDGNDRAVPQTFQCQIQNAGSETIQLDNGATATRRMTEVCQDADLTFTNTYWVDKRLNRIVKSRQWGGTLMGELDITTVYNF